jgi:hypothetical protein
MDKCVKRDAGVSQHAFPIPKFRDGNEITLRFALLVLSFSFNIKHLKFNIVLGLSRGAGPHLLIYPYLPIYFFNLLCSLVFVLCS